MGKSLNYEAVLMIDQNIVVNPLVSPLDQPRY